MEGGVMVDETEVKVQWNLICDRKVADTFFGNR